MSNLKDNAEEKINQWRSSLEHLNMQLHLGSNEAIEEFEKQKKNLSTWIFEMENRLKTAKNISTEKATQFKASLEELRLQTALGKAETKDTLKEQQEKLNNAIHNLQHNISKTYSTSKEFANDFTEETSGKLDDLHARLDLLRLQTHLAQMDANDTWQEKKKEISTKLHNIGNKIDRNKDLTADKLDDFSNEMSEAWKHIRTAFKW